MWNYILILCWLIFVFSELIFTIKLKLYRENNKMFDSFWLGVVKAVVFDIIWIFSSSVQFGGLTTAKPRLWCYCTPLHRYNSLFVQAALHFDSVIVHSGLCKFAIPQKWQTFNLSATLLCVTAFMFGIMFPVNERLLKKKKKQKNTHAHKLMFVSELFVFSQGGEFFFFFCHA